MGCIRALLGRFRSCFWEGQLVVVITRNRVINDKRWTNLCTRNINIKCFQKVTLLRNMKKDSRRTQVFYYAFSTTPDSNMHMRAPIHLKVHSIKRHTETLQWNYKLPAAKLNDLLLFKILLETLEYHECYQNLFSSVNQWEITAA